MRIGALYILYNDEDYITFSLSSIYSYVDKIVICLLEGKPWNGPAWPPDRTARLIELFPDIENKITVIKGKWESEIAQRNEGLDALRDEVDYCLIIDGDEIYEGGVIQNVIDEVGANPQTGQCTIGMHTYWKSLFYRVDPPEPHPANIITKVTPTTQFVSIRRTNEEPVMPINRDLGVMHHFSYARSMEKIWQKINGFSHSHEIVPGWYENIWMKWDLDKSMNNLHPVDPPCYEKTVLETVDDLPAVMRNHPFANMDIINDSQKGQVEEANFVCRDHLAISIQRKMPDGVKLNLGCGNKKISGYINIDAVKTDATDLVADVTDLSWLPSESVEEIRMDAVFEHFYRYQQDKALQEYYRVLQKSGRLVINWLPDFDLIIEAYREKAQGILSEVFDLYHVYRFSHGDPQPFNSPHQLHKDIFTKESIEYLLNEAGFVVRELKNARFEDEYIPININIVAVKE